MYESATTDENINFADQITIKNLPTVLKNQSQKSVVKAAQQDNFVMPWLNVCRKVYIVQRPVEAPCWSFPDPDIHPTLCVHVPSFTEDPDNVDGLQWASHCGRVMQRPLSPRAS